MTDDAAAIVYEEIQKTDVLTGAKYMSFAEGVEEGLIRFVGDDCKRALYDAIESRQVRPGLCKTAGLKLVYSPLNGSGLVPVTQVLKDIGITDITIEQEYPNGYFTTCSYPNPEIFEALELGLNLAKESDADLMLATDPDADRVGIAMKCPDGSYELVSGNEVGVLLLDYICAGRIEKGTMPEKAVKSLVSTPLADAVAAHYGVELRNVLTGFKWIGDQIAQLEAAGEVDRFIFGFEESYGYLTGTHIRDKDGISSSLVMCQMAAYWKQQGKTLIDVLEDLFAEHGYYIDDQLSFVFEGAAGADRIASIMKRFRSEGESVFADICELAELRDYSRGAEGVAEANVLKFMFSNGSWAAARPSGTEPKVKFYCCIKDRDREQAEKLHSLLKNRIEKEVEQA